MTPVVVNKHFSAIRETGIVCDKSNFSYSLPKYFLNAVIFTDRYVEEKLKKKKNQKTSWLTDGIFSLKEALLTV